MGRPATPLPDMYEKDLEKNPAEAGVGNISYEKRPSYVYADSGAVPGEAFEYGNSIFAKAQRFAGKMKIEQRGIERVPETERTDNKHPYLNVATMVCGRRPQVFAQGSLRQTTVALCKYGHLIFCPRHLEQVAVRTGLR